MLGCQRRPQSFAHFARVFLAHQAQHLQAKPLGLGTAGLPPHTTMLQPLGALVLITPPDPLRLPVAQAEDRRGVDQAQGLFLYPSQHSEPSQLPAAHPCPIQSDLRERSSDYGTFLTRPKGDIIKVARHIRSAQVSSLV